MATNLAVDDNFISEALEIGGCKTKKAAECYNICPSAGILGSTIDFLICALAERENEINITPR
ncbi:type II toxin-antitoxin system VapB family antitoxin [Methanospirillum sp.]|uniref:type II toxin-antitoxin system VapB family antitoxin n=1 Tax=Methanospirillum sp. TaxID=45200 RepID=UPI002BB5F386|nr:type II toxin-antitoxin system VapB family antitoxin [Methanospirillum sp.]HPP77513.1 type II toxin-antitoxin system VapB family antitoxin [Methanospirillum sp.]